MTALSCFPWQRLVTPMLGDQHAARLRPSLDLAQSINELLAVQEGFEMAKGEGHGSMVSRLQAEQSVAATHVGQLLRIVMVCLQDSSAESEPEGYVLMDLLVTDVPRRLLACLPALDFEDRKAAMWLFSSLLRHAEGGEQVAEHICRHPSIFLILLKGCGDQDVFSHCADMLRASTRSACLVHALFEAGAAGALIDLALHQSFDISSEAFASLRQLMSHTNISAAHVESSFDRFFASYHKLLQADTDYVIKRQALKLLREALDCDSFAHVSAAYVLKQQFLQSHMNLLRDISASIRMDAFHVFKLFVANRHRPSAVEQTLARNSDKLVKILEGFFSRKVDEHFARDVTACLDMLQVIDQKF